MPLQPNLPEAFCSALATTPLALNFTHPTDSVRRAYVRCKDLEQELAREAEAVALLNMSSVDAMRMKKKIINVRILGHFLAELRNRAAAAISLSNDILSCPNNEGIVKLGEAYDMSLIRLFYRNRLQALAPTHYPGKRSDLSWQDPRYTHYKDLLLDRTKRVPKTRVQANNNALVRDDFCCLVTGSVDIKLVNAHETLRDKARVVDGKPLLCYMAGIPIFPKAMCRGRFWWQDESASENSRWFEIMETLGYKHVCEQLAGHGPRATENTLTLDYTLASIFSDLNLWFEATGTPNRYNVVYHPAMYSWHPQFMSSVVQFATHNSAEAGVELPVPCPEYLEVHAMCCRVAHSSGLAAYFSELEAHLDPDNCDLESPDTLFTETIGEDETESDVESASASEDEDEDEYEYEGGMVALSASMARIAHL